MNRTEVTKNKVVIEPIEVERLSLDLKDNLVLIKQEEFDSQRNLWYLPQGEASHSSSRRASSWDCESDG